MRFLRIHPVQKVINNPTQLSGRGFPRIFHMKLVLSQLYVFGHSKMDAGPCKLNIYLPKVVETLKTLNKSLLFGRKPLKRSKIS